MAERLDAFLSHRGFGTRSETRALVRRGQVRVDDLVCRDPGHRIDGHRVLVEGDEVAEGLATATIVVHKPIGYACSHDSQEAPLIEELYPEEYRHLALETAGRLDRDTSGLLVATTEGDLIHQLTNPRKKLLKRYRITYQGRLSSHAVERCQKGIMLEGDPRPTLPAKLVLLDTGADGLGHAVLHLAEGRYHQVRRMVAALGGEVVGLHRDRIGDLDLPEDLGPGTSRAITPRELRLLIQQASSEGGSTDEEKTAALPDPVVLGHRDRPPGESILADLDRLERRRS